MPTQTEIDAAADRLRRVNDGTSIRDVYDVFSFSLAIAMYKVDLETIADAYLALGTRQPDEMRVFADGKLWNIDAIDDLFREEFPDAKLVRVVTFIQEIEQ